jgi:hypothetical protein
VPSTTTNNDHTDLPLRFYRRRENQSPCLDETVGSAWTSKAKILSYEMNKMSSELRSIFGQGQSSLRTTLDRRSFVGGETHVLCYWFFKLPSNSADIGIARAPGSHKPLGRETCYCSRSWRYIRRGQENVCVFSAPVYRG